VCYDPALEVFQEIDLRVLAVRAQPVLIFVEFPHDLAVFRLLPGELRVIGGRHLLLLHGEMLAREHDQFTEASLEVGCLVVSPERSRHPFDELEEFTVLFVDGGNADFVPLFPHEGELCGETAHAFLEGFEELDLDYGNLLEDFTRNDEIVRILQCLGEEDRGRPEKDGFFAEDVVRAECFYDRLVRLETDRSLLYDLQIQ